MMSLKATGDVTMTKVENQDACKITAVQLPANSPAGATVPMVLTPDQLALVTGGLYIAPPVPSQPRPGIYL